MSPQDVVLLVVAAVLVPLAGVLAGIDAALVRVSAAQVEEIEAGGSARGAHAWPRSSPTSPGAPTCCCCSRIASPSWARRPRWSRWW